MIVQCDGHLTCKKDCPAKQQIDTGDLPKEFSDPGSCYHNKHVDGNYRECGLWIVPDDQQFLPKLTSTIEAYEHMVDFLLDTSQQIADSAGGWIKSIAELHKINVNAVKKARSLLYDN